MSDGLTSAVASAVAEAGPMGEAAPVALLLPLGDAAEIEAARDAAPDRDAGRAVQAVRKAGRPPGAMNKRTGAWRDYLLGRYAHPLEVLAQTYSRPVETLAAELGCTKLEAFQTQVRAAAELAPFVESKMPVGVAIDARGTVQLVIHGAESVPGAVLGGAIPDDEDGLAGMLRNQRVSAA